VRCGYVTIEAAERYYGVVFRPGTTEVDIAASDLLRAKMRAQGLPHDEPTAEPAVPPATAQDHAHQEHERLTDEERLVLAMSCRCCS
jgi:N-methylhydantoinase B